MFNPSRLKTTNLFLVDAIPVTQSRTPDWKSDPKYCTVHITD